MSKYINEEQLKADVNNMSDEELEIKMNEVMGRLVIGATKLDNDPNYKDLVDFAEAIIIMAGIVESKE